jgi:hypothetical protein
MSRIENELGGMARQRSGWLVPLAVFFVTACLSALVLAYYFAPNSSGLVEELPAPTDATRPVALSVGKVAYRIPANYIVLASARRGGDLREVGLLAMLPNFEGYTIATAPELTDNAPDSVAIHFSLASQKLSLPEQERVDRIYMHQVEDASGQPGPFGLRQYVFRADSGYRNTDLFVGAAETGPIVLLCDKVRPEVTSPNCFRDLPLANGLSLSYRLKRGQLEQWRKIDGGLRALVERFAVKP